MALFQKQGKWFIDYYAEGRRIRECAGTSKRLAERALAARRGEIAQGRFKLQEVKPGPRFEDVAGEYLEWARDHLRSSKRQERAVARLKEHFAGRRLKEITPWLIEKYKHQRLQAKAHERKRVDGEEQSNGDGRTIRPTTINRELACLKRMFNLAIAWGKVEANPMRGVKMFPEDGRRERILTPEEALKLLGVCADHLRPIVMLALDTGMRRGEILGLTWERVNLGHGVVTLTTSKNGRGRRLPLSPSVRVTLRAWPRTGPYVFGGERRLVDIKTAWHAACRRAGLAGVRFHDLRHTWATTLVLSGVSLRVVQELGGWCSLAMVERYTHPTQAASGTGGALERLFAAGNGHQMDTKPVAAVLARLTSVRS